MQNAVFSEAMTEKVSQALEMIWQRAEKRNIHEQGEREVVGGNLEKKDKAPAHRKGTKRGTEIPGPASEQPKKS